MHRITTDAAQAPPLPTGRELGARRREWPATAQSACQDLRQQLDRWCREHGWSTTTNDWIAEAAVRQAWASGYHREVAP